MLLNIYKTDKPATSVLLGQRLNHFQDSKAHNYYTDIFQCFVQGSMADLGIYWILGIKVLYVYVFWTRIWKQRAER